jgi:hypothetical protein
MSRSEQISEIIQSRRKLAHDVIDVKQTLESLDDLLLNLREQQRHIPSSSLVNKTADPIENIDFKSIHERIVKERFNLDLLVNRFDRSKLNIGVIGQGRQGKSLLLQKLTNLSGSEIPDGDGDFCTGALSRICHQSGKAEAEARLHYYSEAEFLEEVIAPYYRRLNLGDPPKSLADFRENLPKSLRISSEDSNFKECQVLFEQFRKEYCLNLLKYENRIKQSHIPNIPRDKIKEYVTQERDSQGNRLDFENLALREVEINCSFGDDDIGDIAFVDLPGVGDAKGGFLDLERLVKTLRKDVDFILFVCLPDMGNWKEEDVNLYKAARSAFGDFPLGDCSFMILNYFESRKNKEHCERFRESLQSEQISAQIDVHDCVVANFANHDEVKNKILVPVLNYLSDNIGVLNRKYAESCQIRINKIRGDLLDVLSDCGMISGDGEEMKLFMSLRDSLLRKIKIGLQEKREELNESKSKNDEDFVQQIQNAIEKCRDDEKAIPELAAISEKSRERGCYRLAYYHYLLDMRRDFNKYFIDLDEKLQEKLDLVRSEISKVFSKPGMLHGLEKEKPKTELLEEIVNRCGLSSSSTEDLAQAFGNLSKYVVLDNFSIKNRLQVHIDKLDPDTTPDPFSQQSTAEQAIKFCVENFESVGNELLTPISPEGAITLMTSKMLQLFLETSVSQAKVPLRERVRSSLISLRNLVIEDCEKELEEMGNAPNKLAYSMMREFSEKVAKENVEKQWELFFYDNKSQIWDEFEALEQHEKFRQKWLSLVEQAKTLAAKSDSFQIFK